MWLKVRLEVWLKVRLEVRLEVRLKVLAQMGPVVCIILTPIDAIKHKVKRVPRMRQLRRPGSRGHARIVRAECADSRASRAVSVLDCMVFLRLTCAPRSRNEVVVSMDPPWYGQTCSRSFVVPSFVVEKSVLLSAAMSDPMF